MKFHHTNPTPDFWEKCENVLYHERFLKKHEIMPTIPGYLKTPIINALNIIFEMILFFKYASINFRFYFQYFLQARQKSVSTRLDSAYLNV